MLLTPATFTDSQQRQCLSVYKARTINCFWHISACELYYWPLSLFTGICQLNANRLFYFWNFIFYLSTNMSLLILCLMLKLWLSADCYHLCGSLSSRNPGLIFSLSTEGSQPHQGLGLFHQFGTQILASSKS
jgi:hypothetical protein